MSRMPSTGSASPPERALRPIPGPRSGAAPVDGPAPSSTSDPVAGLRTTLLRAVADQVEPGLPWTAVDYPRYFNCGDTAIWLGQMAVADALGCPVEAVLDRWTYRADRVVPGSTVVITGGGNFGGLYPTHHRLRLQVLHELRGHRVVQMPQSIEFAGELQAHELRTAIRDHGDFVLLVRDERSLERARTVLQCDVQLAPDLAFGLGRLPRPVPSAPLAALVREDAEAPEVPSGLVRAERFDWITPDRRDRARWELQLADLASKAWNTRATSALGERLWRPATRRFSAANMDRAVGLVGRGERFVTDRLHGHVLAGLLGIEHVVVNDKYGKVRALWDTWTSVLPGARFAATWDDLPADALPTALTPDLPSDPPTAGGTR
jgi:pyruvyl transferase EpsO